MKDFFKKDFLITFFLGFSSGLPLLLTLRTLQAWMTDRNVSLAAVGYMSLAQAPYTFKFLWAPIFDRYALSKYGRRKTWLLLTQMGIFLALVFLSQLDPAVDSVLFKFAVLGVAFFSASQDTLVDALRRESLSDAQLAMGSSVYFYGYRLAMWVSGGLALALAEKISWSSVYLIMAGLGIIGVMATILADEPQIPGVPPRSLKEAVFNPLIEFFSRPGSLVVLSFILFYKIGDVMAGNMLTPFYLKMGYSKLEISLIAKTLSLPLNFIGGFLGGLYVLKKGIFKGLLLFGILQAFATLWFQVLTAADHSNWALGAVILSEDLATSMATAAFLAFMASLTNRQFTATQYALLAGLAGIPRVIFAAPTGVLAEYLGWNGFFTFCTLMAIPGLLLLFVLKKKGLFAAH